MVETYKAKHPRNIAASYYKPIGQILVRWNFTELYLQSVIWHIWKIKDPKAGRLLTWDKNAEAKIDLFKRLSPRWITDTDDQKELNAIAKEADFLRKKRNLLAHGLWGYKPKERKIVRLLEIKRESRITAKSHLIKVSEIKVWASRLDKLNIRLVKFHRHLGAPVP